MSSWVVVGSKEDIEHKNKEAMSAYLRWIDYSESISFEEAFTKFEESRWKPSWHRWVTIFIINQSESKLNLLRVSVSLE